MIGVQVGRMGYVPACGGNGNSRNVSCSKPSLHCRKSPWEEALYKWLTKSASDAMHMALYKRTTFTFTLHTDVPNMALMSSIFENEHYSLQWLTVSTRSRVLPPQSEMVPGLFSVFIGLCSCSVPVALGQLPIGHDA